MHFLGEKATLLAARLARSLGDLGVVCLGCEVERVATAPRSTVITVSPPPFRRLEIELGHLLLLVALLPGAGRLDLKPCAAGAVPEVWLYDSGEGVIESLRLPHSGRYRQRSLILPGESVSLAALPEVELMPLPRSESTRA